MSTDRGMDKDVVYRYNGVLLSHKKEWNLAICDNMDGPAGIMLNEMSDRERQMISLIYGIQKTKQMNKHNKRETDLYIQ